MLETITASPLFLIVVGVLAITLFILVFHTILRRPNLLFILPFLGIVVGELVRIPLPGIGAVAILDGCTALTGMVWILVMLRQRTKLFLGPIGVVAGVFCTLAILSLGQSLSSLPLSSVAQGAVYLMRFMMYFLLYFVVANSAFSVRSFVRLLAISGALLALLGFFQLYLVPDFLFMTRFGWDPHIGRLLSTWFDPNFLAGFFVFSVTIVAHFCLSRELSAREKILLLISCLLMLAALVLTYSRSGYLMGIVCFGILGLIRAPKASVLGILLLILISSLIPRVRDRVGGMVSGVLGTIRPGYEYSLDETSRLRVQSWQQGWQVFQKYPWFGTGYNTLRTVKIDEGYVSDVDIHSGSGWDSSLLTILTTTGIFGFLAYLCALGMVFVQSVRLLSAKNSENSLFALSVIVVMVGLLVHALFVNSLLLPAFLALQFLITGLIDREVSVTSKKPLSS